MRKAKEFLTMFRRATAAVLLPVLVGAAVTGCSDESSKLSSADGKTQPTSAANRGNEIIAEMLRRDAAPYQKIRVRFNIMTADEENKTYELEVWRKRSENGTVTFTQIVKPLEDSDLASLTDETPGKPTTVTTYSSTLKDFRETGTNKMFFGGITAGELLGEWDRFDFRLVKEDPQQFQLEGRLKNGEFGTVARMEVSMRSDNYVPMQLRLFDSSEKHIRTFDVLETRSDEHGTYAFRTVVDNPIYRSKTEIEVLSREFPATIDAAIFTKERLKAIATRQKPA
jgi:hypothetical protein